MVQRIKDKLVDFILRKWKIIQLEKELLTIESFEEWIKIAKALDHLDFNKRAWREKDES